MTKFRSNLFERPRPRRPVRSHVRTDETARHDLAISALEQFPHHQLRCRLNLLPRLFIKSLSEDEKVDRQPDEQRD